METKICIKCGEELPKTDKYFGREKKNKDGLINTCKKCKAEYNKKYREKNKEHITKLMKQYYETHKKDIDKQREKYYEKNKEELAIKRRQYNKENKEIVAERNKRCYEKHKKTYDEHRKRYNSENKDKIAEIRHRYYKKNIECRKQYLEKNKDKIREQKKQYYEINKDKLSKRFKKWQENNREKSRVRDQRRSARKRQLPSTLTVEQWNQIKESFNNKCAYCGKEKFLTQEHFIPLSKGGEYSKSNIIPACRSCNCSKQDKDFFQWYETYKYYSKERQEKIIEFLGYKDNKQQLSLII